MKDIDQGNDGSATPLEFAIIAVLICIAGTVGFHEIAPTIIAMWAH